MKMMSFITLLAVSVSMTGCLNNELLRRGTVSSRSDVFVEADADVQVPDDYVLLRIVTSFKTPAAWERRPDGATQIVNIDGQALRMTDAGTLEDRDPDGSQDPEAGRGMRHVFRVDLLVKPGPHQVIVALPDQEVATSREITLPEHLGSLLWITPRYRSLPSFRGVHTTETSFTKGVFALDAEFNGWPLGGKTAAK